MHKKYTRVNIPRCVNILRCANQPVSKFKLCSHGFYHQEYFVCKFIISGFKPVHLSFLEEAASRCFCRTLAAEENHVMLRHNLSSYTVPFSHPLLKWP